jgi:hypothetical protein
MNQGTHQNIMNQLGMTSDEYNLVTVVYYVCQIPDILCFTSASNLRQDTLHYWRSPIELAVKVFYALKMAITNHSYVGCFLDATCCCS